MRSSCRVVLLIVVGVVLAAAAGGPWVAYSYGLSVVEGKPKTSDVVVPAAEKERLWQEYEPYTSEREMRRLTPYHVIGNVFCAANAKGKSEIDVCRAQLPGYSLASQVAREYIQEHGDLGSGLDWHLASVALTIWISRNWTTSEVLSRVEGAA